MRARGDVAELERVQRAVSFDAEDADATGEQASAGRLLAVRVASAGESLQSGQEALGGRRRGHFREHVLQSALRVGLGLALRTGGKVRQYTLARLMTELAVHQGGKSVSQVLLRRRRT